MQMDAKFFLQKDKQFAKDIKEFLLNKISDQSKRNELLKMLENEKVGLLLNERMVNIPPQISPPLHKGLFEELASARQKTVRH